MSRTPTCRTPIFCSVIGAVALTLPALAGCGEEGSFELSWTIGKKPVTSIRDCSSHGLDSVEVLAQSSGESRRAIFPCYSPNDGPVGRGPGLEPGQTPLTVYGLSASALRLTAPVQATVEIPETGLTSLDVDIPEPPQCLDGVDNDGDGFVDLLDTGCESGSDPSEAGGAGGGAGQ